MCQRIEDHRHVGMLYVIRQLLDAEPDVLAYMSFPPQHRTKLHSTNPLEQSSRPAARSAPPGWRRSSSSRWRWRACLALGLQRALRDRVALDVQALRRAIPQQLLHRNTRAGASVSVIDAEAS
jgi:hypothetical protein